MFASHLPFHSITQKRDTNGTQSNNAVPRMPNTTITQVTMTAIVHTLTAVRDLQSFVSPASSSTGALVRPDPVPACRPPAPGDAAAAAAAAGHHAWR